MIQEVGGAQRSVAPPAEAPAVHEHLDCSQWRVTARAFTMTGRRAAVERRGEKMERLRQSSRPVTSPGRPGRGCGQLGGDSRNFCIAKQ